jgi:putative transposon-encoded protein
MPILDEVAITFAMPFGTLVIFKEVEVVFVKVVPPLIE